MPAVDIFENEDEFVVTAELPGIREEDIEVSVADGKLVIKGVKKTETGFTQKKYHRCERIGGSFCREIVLPLTVDSRKVEAVFEDGVLEVSLSKTDEAKPKKIAVSARRNAGGEQVRKSSALSEAWHGW